MSTWKNLFPNHFLFFFLSLHLYQCMVLAKLLHFFSTNPWFIPYFKFLLCIVCILYYKLATSFSTFPISICSSKNGKSLWSLCGFCWCRDQLREIIIIFILVFYEVYIEFKSISNPKKSPTSNFCDIAYSYNSLCCSS